jgi:uncharacterized membrane protein
MAALWNVSLVGWLVGWLLVAAAAAAAWRRKRPRIHTKKYPSVNLNLMEGTAFAVVTYLYTVLGLDGSWRFSNKEECQWQWQCQYIHRKYS